MFTKAVGLEMKLRASKLTLLRHRTSAVGGYGDEPAASVLRHDGVDGLVIAQFLLGAGHLPVGAALCRVRQSTFKNLRDLPTFVRTRGQWPYRRAPWMYI